jgi:hypothetical protein
MCDIGGVVATSKEDGSTKELRARLPDLNNLVDADMLRERMTHYQGKYPNQASFKAMCERVEMILQADERNSNPGLKSFYTTKKD